MQSHIPSVSKPSLWAGRILSGLLVLLLLADGAGKVLKLPAVLKACDPLGIPRDAIFGIGVTLIVCTLLYAIPRTSILGAILLTGYLGGAVFTHVRVGGSEAYNAGFAATLGVLVWLGLFLREGRLRSLIPLR